jgi:hypothetical protein
MNSTTPAVATDIGEYLEEMENEQEQKQLGKNPTTIKI